MIHYLSVGRAGVAFEVAKVTRGVFQTEAGLVSFGHLAAGGHFQQVVVVVPGGGGMTQGGK